MRTPRPRRGRPRTSPLSREEQLRAAKRAQRAREREAGFESVQLRLPEREARRLRVAVQAPGFREALADFLDRIVVDIAQYPRLRELAWNRAVRWIPARDALSLYERNWRFLEPDKLTREEALLIESLRDRFGAGLIHA